MKLKLKKYVMKKLILAFILAVGFSFALQAQTETEVTAVKQAQTTNDIATKDYKKMDGNSLPVATLEKVGTKYGGYSIEEIYRADNGDYRLVLAKGGTKTTAYFNKKGEEIMQTK